MNALKLSMDEKTIKAVLTALEKGQRVELTPQKDGSVRVRTVWRKDIKV